MFRISFVGFAIAGIFSCFVNPEVCVAQRSSELVVGQWKLAEGNDITMDVQMQFAPDGKAGLHFEATTPEDLSLWQHPGNWSVVEEDHDEEMRPLLKLEVEWSTNPGVKHNVGIVFLDQDRLEMKFNDEPLRVYRRKEE